MKGMQTESRARFINHFYAEQAMYLALKMAGIEAEVGHCTIRLRKFPGDIGMPFRVCIADGRIWDVAFHFPLPYPCKENSKEVIARLPEWAQFPPKSTRVYLPLPSDDDIKTHPLGLRKALSDAKMTYHITLGICTIPELDPFFADKIPYQELAITWEAREMMSTHYMDMNDRRSIIKMYGTENIENLMEESIEDFKARMNSFVRKHPNIDERSRHLSNFEESRWRENKTVLQEAFRRAENKQEMVERNKKTVTRFTDLVDPSKINKFDMNLFSRQCNF